MSHTQQQIQQLAAFVSEHIIGQQTLINRLMIALLADGHLLVEGAPGLAKTKAVKALASGLESDFHRIQFTPDLLPSDVTGVSVWDRDRSEFVFRTGPVFANVVLGDEINRASPKTQSALLEAMQERQVSVGQTTYDLPRPFFVIATQNPIEQEGTYPLPEAQLDRFMFNIHIDYPRQDVEEKILAETTRGRRTELESVISAQEILDMQDLVEEVA